MDFYDKLYCMWYKLANNKVLYILRGPSGSGKSTLAKKMGITGHILSTDDFWMQDGKYVFDPKKLSEAHNWNQERANKYMREGISPLVIDNTNIEPWEMKPYVMAAKEHGYEVKLVPVEVKNTADELAARNVHSVPKFAIEKMLSKYNPNVTIDDIMKSEKPDFRRGK